MTKKKVYYLTARIWGMKIEGKETLHTIMKLLNGLVKDEQAMGVSMELQPQK